MEIINKSRHHQLPIGWNRGMNVKSENEMRSKTGLFIKGHGSWDGVFIKNISRNEHLRETKKDFPTFPVAHFLL